MSTADDRADHNADHNADGSRERELVDRWLDAFGSDDPVATATGLLHPDAEFVEHPNLLSPDGSRRDRAAMVAGIEAGGKLLRWQRFADRELADVAPGRVLVTCQWSGELAVDLGAWAAGTVLRADVAALVDVVDGTIRRQENWDCYHRIA